MCISSHMVAELVLSMEGRLIALGDSLEQTEEMLSGVWLARQTAEVVQQEVGTLPAGVERSLGMSSLVGMKVIGKLPTFGGDMT